jgi:hypothetical protein
MRILLTLLGLLVLTAAAHLLLSCLGVRRVATMFMLRTATLSCPSGGVDMRYQPTPINTRPWLLNGLSLRLSAPSRRLNARATA